MVEKFGHFKLTYEDSMLIQKETHERTVGHQYNLQIFPESLSLCLTYNICCCNIIRFGFWKSFGYNFPCLCAYTLAIVFYSFTHNVTFSFVDHISVVCGSIIGRSLRFCAYTLIGKPLLVNGGGGF